MALVVTAVRLAHRRAPDWRALASVAAGLLAGWVLRPNPIGAARLARVQVVDLLLVKRARVPLAFGVELAPFGGFNFVDQLVPIAALVTLALGYLVWLIARRRYRSLPSSRQIAVWSSLILCAGFLVLTFTVARRANELFVVFAVLFAGLLATPPG